MSKKAPARNVQSYVSSRQSVMSRQKSRRDAVARWLGRRSRLVRSILAAVIALGFTGVIGLLLYNFLYGLPPSNALYPLLDQPDLLVIILIALTCIGFAFYWLGWRLMIGFDFGENSLVPGRAAATWLMVGLAVFVVTLILSAITAVTALQ
ncbi:MAG: hypothetical protein ABI947_19865 [Chloroflexota bacterium]